MNIANIPPGKYVVAVSGGIDSVVLLHLLRQHSDLQLVVAHFDHGMRAESASDARFVARLAAHSSLPYVTKRAELTGRGEEVARKARYDFLRHVQESHQATAIITAHHQDDVLETVIINLLRGTGWRGLCSLRDTARIRRPLLSVPKSEIIAFAKAQNLEWREDETNTDTYYLRNRVRHHILPQAGTGFRQELLALIVRQQELRGKVEALTDILFENSTVEAPNAHSSFESLSEIHLARHTLIMVPSSVAKELLAKTVKRLTGKSLQYHSLARMLWFSKTGRPHKTLQTNSQIELFVTKTTVVVRRR